jgi:hypothetical protein
MKKNKTFKFEEQVIDTDGQVLTKNTTFHQGGNLELNIKTLALRLIE